MDTGLWTAIEAAAVTGGALCARGALADNAVLPEEAWSATGFSIDTRTIQPGDIFVALKDARDGHDFVRNAFEAGASAALVSRAPENTPDGKPLLLVNDTLTGLTDLASAARDRCFGKLIAVTGSAGKTSTKEMLRNVLGASGKVHAADKSFNNHLGVPLTLAALPSDADYGVFEIGMNHAGEITPLSQLVQPHVAIVTTVAAAHLEFFDSVEDIAKAKAEIFSGLRTQNGHAGVAILPKDNDYFDLLANGASKMRCRRLISFGSVEGSDIRMLDYATEADGASRVRVNLFGNEHVLRIGVPGQHQAMNALAVLGAAKAVGADMGHAIEALSTMRPIKGRGERLQLFFGATKVMLIDESYNANPASMKASIALLGNEPAMGRKIAVLGEMRELGDNAEALHAVLADELCQAGIDSVFVAGPMMHALYRALPENMRGGFGDTAQALAEALMASLGDGDVIMAKGSNASKVGALVDILQQTSKDNV